MTYKLLLALLVTLTVQAFGTSSQAVLSRYAIRTTNLTQYGDVSPSIGVTPPTPGTPAGTAVVDNDGGSGSPLLKRYTQVAGGSAGTTVDLPGLSGFIFLKDKTIQGPSEDQTGAGDIGNTIEWGFVDSWSVSGGQFCHSVPSFVCDRATREDLSTVPPALISPLFDFNSWAFHPTGYRAVGGYISFTGTTDGNTQTFSRGALMPNGTVPALPLLGIGAIGISIIAMGMAGLRRK